MDEQTIEIEKMWKEEEPTTQPTVEETEEVNEGVDTFTEEEGVDTFMEEEIEEVPSMVDASPEEPAVEEEETPQQTEDEPEDTEEGEEETCEKTSIHLHPFTYGFGDEGAFIPFTKQRQASYKTPATEIYNNEKLSDKELQLRAFTGTIEVPTPQLKQVDGFKSEAEIAEGE